MYQEASCEISKCIFTLTLIPRYPLKPESLQPWMMVKTSLDLISGFDTFTDQTTNRLIKKITNRLIVSCSPALDGARPLGYVQITKWSDWLFCPEICNQSACCCGNNVGVSDYKQCRGDFLTLKVWEKNIRKSWGDYFISTWLSTVLVAARILQPIHFHESGFSDVAVVLHPNFLKSIWIWKKYDLCWWPEVRVSCVWLYACLQMHVGFVPAVIAFLSKFRCAGCYSDIDAITSQDPKLHVQQGSWVINVMI